MLINTYRENAELFIDGEVMRSQEGTTQGDPLAMGMYALGILPLIMNLDHIVKQVWYADDASVGGKLVKLCEWWYGIISLGLKYSYYANPLKIWLIVKPEHFLAASEVFHGTGVQITSEGRRHLGAVVGCKSFTVEYMEENVSQWVNEGNRLSTIAVTHPQVAYAAFTHCFINKWSYFMRTTPNIANIFQPLEDAIRLCLITAITGKSSISDFERDLFSFPTRLGSLKSCHHFITGILTLFKDYRSISLCYMPTRWAT